jgi:hypothetical protein
LGLKGIQSALSIIEGPGKFGTLHIADPAVMTLSKFRASQNALIHDVADSQKFSDVHS